MRTLRIGPIATEGADAWIDNTLALLDALEGSPLLPFALGEEAADAMRGPLVNLRGLVAGRSEVTWDCDVDGPVLRSLLTYWLNIGRLSDDTLAAAGATWADEAGEQFHSRLLRSVIDGLAELDAEYADYAERLERAWRAPVVDRGRS